MIAGKCLADARKRAGVSQEEMAKRLGKPQTTISVYERGQRRIDVLELGLIAKAIGVDPAALLTEILREAASNSRSAATKTSEAVGSRRPAKRRAY